MWVLQGWSRIQAIRTRNMFIVIKKVTGLTLYAFGVWAQIKRSGSNIEAPYGKSTLRLMDKQFV